MSSLRSQVQVEALAYVKAAGQTGAHLDDVIEHLYHTFSTEIEAQGSKLAREWLRAATKQTLSEAEANGVQALLPGFDLPRVITTYTSESDVVYVATIEANRDQWRSHRMLKERNVAAAVAELNKYDELTDQLETVWLEHPEWSVGQCVKALS